MKKKYKERNKRPWTCNFIFVANEIKGEYGCRN